MGTGVMPLPEVRDVLGKLEGNSALTPALSPRRGRNGRRGRIVRPQRRACAAAISWLRTRPVATIGAGTSQKGRRSKAMAGRRERQPPLLGERAGVRAEFCAAVGDVLGDVAADFGGGFLGMTFDLDHVRHAAAEAAFEGPVRVHVFGVFHGDWGIRSGKGSVPTFDRKGNFSWPRMEHGWNTDFAERGGPRPQRVAIANRLRTRT